MMKIAISISLILSALLMFNCSKKTKNYEVVADEQLTEESLSSLGSELNDSTGNNNQVYTSVAEDYPDFPGGEEGLKKFLLKNVKYPTTAKSDNLEGVVFISFIISDKGSVDNIEVVRGVRGDLDNAAVAAVKMMPDWEPGHIQGKPIPVRYYLPVRFILAKETEVEHRSERLDFQLYPNPAKEIVTISVLDDFIDSEYRIYDLSGKEMISGVISESETEVRLDKLVHNTYILKVFSPDHQSKSKRLVINK